MASHDGGPAFPLVVFSDSAAEMQSSGLSIRDYFAGQAMPAILANGELVVTLRQKYGARVTLHIAETAYEFADAMLAARAK